MPASYPRDPVIAFVSEGFGSLLVHCAARRFSLENREITILATNHQPVATYQQYPHNLGQTVLRSEFESHFLVPDRPKVAQLDAYKQQSRKPLGRTRSEAVGRRPGPDRPDAVLSPTPAAAHLG